MKLTAQVKLLPTPKQADMLKATLQQANAACNAISARAWASQTFGQYKLHKQVYAAIRAEFNLTAQVVVRAIAKVADAYKLDRKTKRTFRPLGSFPFDDRILRWYTDKGFVSIWTVAGRERILFACGERQRQLLLLRQGESDLVYKEGQFYLLATCNVDDPDLLEVTEVLGVDLGIVNLAVDSEGISYSGQSTRERRRKACRLRAALQHQATKHHSKSAYRHLQRFRRHVARFTRWVNHNISRPIVNHAASSMKAIALENLSGIRQRDSALSREMRFELGNWSFRQLQQMILYKATLAGVPVIFVDPRNTSRTCPRCGCCKKENRPRQNVFQCQQCGFQAHADFVGATNIRRKGLEARGIVTCPRDGIFSSGLSDDCQSRPL